MIKKGKFLSQEASVIRITVIVRNKLRCARNSVLALSDRAYRNCVHDTIKKRLVLSRD